MFANAQRNIDNTVLPFNLVRVAPAQPKAESNHTPLPALVYNANVVIAQSVKLFGLGFVDGWKSI